MNCTEAKRYLDLFLDGELDVEQNLKVLEHLNLCTCCSKIFDGEKALTAEIARQGAECCPEQLKQRCAMALDHEGRVAWRPWAAAAAMLAIGVAIGWFIRPASVPVIVQLPAPNGTAASLAGSLVGIHNANRTRAGAMAVSATGGEARKAELAAFYKSKGVEACLHCMERRGYRFSSGEVWKDGVRGRMVCLTTQVSTDHDAVLTHTTVGAGDISFTGGAEATWDQRPVRVFTVDGRVVILEQCGPHICVFVADSPAEAEKLGIAMK